MPAKPRRSELDKNADDFFNDLSMNCRLERLIAENPTPQRMRIICIDKRFVVGYSHPSDAAYHTGACRSVQ